MSTVVTREDEFRVASPMTRSIAKQISADGNDLEFLEYVVRDPGRKNRKGWIYFCYFYSTLYYFS